MDFLGENGLTRLWEHVTSKLNTKVNKVNGMGLSSNDYTEEDKDKLTNIEAGAQVNTVTSVNGKTGVITLTASDLGVDVEDSIESLDLAKAYTDEVASTKADSEHTHENATIDANGMMSSEDKIKLINTNVAYGTCDTDINVADKIVTIEGNAQWSLVAGSRITVKFHNMNTASAPTLNVNGTGAKRIWYDNSIIYEDTNYAAGYEGRYITYVYDGTYYVFMGSSIDRNNVYTNAKLGQGYTICYTAATTNEKVVSLGNLIIQNGGILTIKFIYNVAASSTIKINSENAPHPIFHRGTVITDSVIKAGDTATFMYNGGVFYLLTVDREGDADSVRAYVDEVAETKANVAHTHKLSDINNLQNSLDNMVPITRTINGKFLTDNISLTATDIGAEEIGSSEETLTLAKEYTDGIADTKANLYHTHTTTDVTGLQAVLDLKVPTSRTINGKELTADVELVASDVGADTIGSATSALENAKSYTDEISETKSDIGHTHNDIYYTEGEIDGKVLEINASITNIVNGTTTVGKANHSLSADSATNASAAEKATMDDAGNSIKETYETKGEAAYKLTEAKLYADGIKNDLLNGAGTAYDTLKELGDLIDDNTDAIDALETVAGGKADKNHTHTIANITNLQNTLDGKASSSHTHSISNITNLQSTLDGKANSSHTHSITSITDLQSTLNGKADTSVATVSANGLMSFADKIKLNNISGKNVYVQNEEPTNAVDGDIWCDLDANDSILGGEIGGTTGENGATFMPSVDSNGILSWTNDKGLANPAPINIKPVKGIDYWTEDDKLEIVQDVLSALPAWTGGSY